MALPPRILVIGSSSIGENGSGMLAKALRSQLSESTVTFFGKSGAGFKAIAEAAQQKVRAVAPDLVLVVMGGNPTGTAAELETAMARFKAALGDTPLLWVGPPVYAAAFNQNITRMYDTVGPRVLGSDYVSSQGWTSPTSGRTSDKVHFTDYGATLWGQKITEWVRERSSPAVIAAVGGGLFVVAAAIAAFWFFKLRAAR
jgi:lysophospholipase L1-like esterase